MTQSKTLQYAAAGVDIDAAERLVARFRALAESTRRPEVAAGVGPFAALFRAPTGRAPLLVASADGVGTKVRIGALLGRYRGLGADLVNHCVNDVLCAGGRPLFFLDYLASNGLMDDARVELVGGMADACRATGAALIGGETADMPDVYRAGDFDIAGFLVGVVEEDAVLGPARVRPGDALLALPSSGLHTNGYSLARRVYALEGADAAARLAQPLPGDTRTLGDALLEVHRCYLAELEPLLPRVHALAHITGGGIPGNLARVLPADTVARVRRRSWRPPALFRHIQAEGRIENDEMFRVFNMGVGMVVVCAADEVDALLAALPGAWRLGEVIAAAGSPHVELR